MLDSKRGGRVLGVVAEGLEPLRPYFIGPS